MAKTVDEGFRIFHFRLTPTKTESTAAKFHRASINACLKSNFEMARFFRTGSFGNGTSIKGHSDVDYFASIPTKHLTQNSTSTLRKVRIALNKRFRNTGVMIRTPAVVVPFGSDPSETTEVVPADYMGENNGYKIYEIADGSGGWMRSSPDAHNAYVAYVNGKLKNKVKPLIRFLKAWKYYRNIPISSFYLEMRTAKYCSGENSIIYSIDVERIFNKLLKDNLALMQDPMGISGYISPCATSAQKRVAISKLKTALSRAKKATAAEDAGRIRVAYRFWNLVFNNKFPAY